MLSITRLSLNLARPTLGRQILRPSVSRLAINQLRSINTVKASDDGEQQILVAQRKNRPVSPHLDIYQPQLTWVLSGAHRITGVGLAVGFYGLTCTYAFTSLLGVPFDAATLVSVAAGLPIALKVIGKAIASFPFAFHVGNGVRHLIWDSGYELYMKGVYRTGYAVLGFTAIFGAYLLFL
ncbi:hypothetical protein B5S28_g3265 [[Candida] boidinii]|nr:hypothetical protein B5S28_g3265 [[Candida] boidinii]OWB63318.1 hypothetical protein B5S29_g4290 [[Candida] boidinii]OWB74553.1 hypothetical protein B5S31_g4356 [[Candida] boidinii]OWB80006.1 hypothetical protein B5S32_g4251 [[Candida] boidinii]